MAADKPLQLAAGSHSSDAAGQFVAVLGMLLCNSCDREDTPLYSATVLSHAHLAREACTKQLKHSLRICSLPLHRSMAS